MAKKQHAQEACNPGEMDRILNDLRSSDETTRARAVGVVCPCRMGFDGFQRAMDIVTTMRKDPSKKVRKTVIHVLEESYQLAGNGRPTSKQMVKNEMIVVKNRNRWPQEG
jgi:vesicle coat complex subunit